MVPGAQMTGSVCPEEVAYKARDEETFDEAVASLRELLQSWETVGSGVFVLHCIVLDEVLNMCQI
jgi:hypothetical protein